MAKSHTGYIFLIVLMGGLAYFNSFTVPFQFDDYPAIVDNSLVHQGSPGELWSFFPQRWVVFESFALNSWISGLDVLGFHILNWLVHVTNALLVYALVLELMRLFRVQESDDPSWRRFAACAAALLFVSHPIQTQAVTYIWQRCTTLVATFFLLTMICHLRSMRSETPRAAGIWLASGLVSGFLAMYCKQSAFALPFVILLLEWLGSREDSGMFRRSLRLPAWLLMIFVIPIQTMVSGDLAIRHMQDLGSLGPFEYFGSQMHVLYRYIGLVVYPLGLSIAHDVAVPDSLLDPGTLLRFAGIASLAGLAFAWRTSRPAMSFAIGFFFLAHATESSFLPLADVMFEHRMYLPLLSFAFILGLGTMKVVRWIGQARLESWASLNRPRLALALCALPLVGLSALRNEVWSSPVSLWRNATQNAPASSRAWDNLGTSCLDAQLFVEAEDALERAVALDPDRAALWNKLGIASSRLGSSDRAERAFRFSLELNPDSFSAVKNLASHLALSGKRDAAVELLREAVTSHSNVEELGSLYFIVCLDAGRDSEARRALDQLMNSGHMDAVESAVEDLIRRRRWDLAETVVRSLLLRPAESADEPARKTGELAVQGRAHRALAIIKTGLRQPELAEQHRDAATQLGVVISARELDQVARFLAREES